MMAKVDDGIQIRMPPTLYRKVQGAGFRVRVQGAGLRVKGSGFRVQDLGFRVEG